MSEGRQVVAGEAILQGVATAGRTQDAMIEALVREHSRLVYRIAYAVLRRHHDAEDSTQETFVRVLRYGSKLRSVEDAKTWVARIAWRVAVDRSRRQDRMREIPLEDNGNPLMEVAAPLVPADQVLQGTQVGRVVEKLIAALPDKLREPLILATIEELTPREIAGTLGINEAAVRSRVFRARQILRERMAERINSR